MSEPARPKGAGNPREKLAANHGGLEIGRLPGGQPLYDYLFSLE
jgi:hypothetical protein